VEADDLASFFRRANEIVRERASAFESEGVVPFICECRDASCLDRVEMSLDEFAGVAERAGRAALAPGHEDPEHDRVVEQTSRFTVIERAAQAANSRRSFKQ
jgi:hypothetical protein